jgi:hypothetical protein
VLQVIKREGCSGGGAAAVESAEKASSGAAITVSQRPRGGGGDAERKVVSDAAAAAVAALDTPSGVQAGSEGGGGRTRGGFHEAAWEAQVARLAAYKAAHGDCKVPGRWAEDKQLGMWVSKQRAGKRKLDRGEPSDGMTTALAARLTAVGLVWDPHEAEWEAQLVQLAAYKVAHGDCSVPRGWAEDPQLATWVDSQRKRKRLLDRGEPDRQGMTAERAARLTAVGLVWDPSGSYIGIRDGRRSSPMYAARG